MKDEILIAEAMNGEVRIHCARSTEMVNKARIAHDTWATCTAALGRTMTVTALMASDLKNEEEKITSIINGHGPAGTILVQAKGNGDVRGFIGDPHVYYSREDGHLDVGRAVGKNGTLTVIKDLGLKEPFSGTVNLQSGEIGIDYAYYFAISEQTPSIVSVGVLVETDLTCSAAGGLIIQPLPNASEETIKKCEEIAGKLRPMSDLIHEGNELDAILDMYFEDAKVLGHKDIQWHCGCSKEHFAESLKTLQTKDLQEMIDDGKGTEITCQYCNSQYNFTSDEIEKLLEEKNVENRISRN